MKYAYKYNLENGNKPLLKYNTNDLPIIKSSYETLIRNIKATNFQVGSTLTLENYISQYEKLNGKLGYGQDKKSWKLSVCAKNKKNVEIDDLVSLDYWFSFNLDRPFYGFRNEKENECVPEYIKNIAIGLPYRDFVTVGILVDRLALKNQTNIK